MSTRDRPLIARPRVRVSPCGDETHVVRGVQAFPGRAPDGVRKKEHELRRALAATCRALPAMQAYGQRSSWDRSVPWAQRLTALEQRCDRKDTRAGRWTPRRPTGDSDHACPERSRVVHESARNGAAHACAADKECGCCSGLGQSATKPSGWGALTGTHHPSRKARCESGR